MEDCVNSVGVVVNTASAPLLSRIAGLSSSLAGNVVAVRDSNGAFVDVGVRQDGLVHISMLADHFVKDPHRVVKTGEVVRVKVIEVDVPRKRIRLSMKLDEPAVQRMADASAADRPRSQSRRSTGAKNKRAGGNPQADKTPQGAMASAFDKAFKNDS